MADRDPMQVLRDMASGYLNPQAYDVEDLKEVLAESHNAERARAFQYALSETIGGYGLDQMQWEDITDDDFEDGDEWLDYLSALYAYLFENGPYPVEEEGED